MLKNCKFCNKKINYSKYEQKYDYYNYCFDCIYNMVQQGQWSCVQHKFKKENCEDCNRSENEKWDNRKRFGNRKRLWRTDNDEDYLDSTRCEYTKTEYNTLIQRRLLLKSRIQQLKIDIARSNDELKEVEMKIAVAEKEQELRKKLRRETRELIPTLTQVQKKADEIQRNIQGITSGEDNRSGEEDPLDLTDDEEFDKLIDEYMNKNKY